MADEAEKPKKCPVCSGWGYIPCEYWPGDCICGYGDEDCEECEGTGRIWPDNEDDFWVGYHDPESGAETTE